MLKVMDFCHFQENLAINIDIITGIDASKRVVQKTAEATGDLIGNKIADKITSIGKPKEKETKKTEKISILPEKRQQIIDGLTLF